jgi:ribokinase
MKTMQPKICVVGSSNIDLTFRTTRLPRPGETISGQTFQMGFGGKGANQAVMASRLGARVTMISKIGQDIYGADILRNYSTQGIDASFVIADAERSTGVAVIVVDEAARNCIIVVGGANQGLAPRDIQNAAAAIQDADILLCQLEIPLETTLKALQIARNAGVRTILNPAPAVALPEELLLLTDICVPNETELEMLTGSAASNMEKVEPAARMLLNRGPGTVIVTLGGNGSLAVTAQETLHVPAPIVNALDPSGAGDAFIGALGVFLAEGLPLHDAVLRANAVAALSVTRLGTQSTYPSRAEAEMFFSNAGRKLTVSPPGQPR